MRRAMAAAEVGDDWYGDDSTVNRLQEACAAATGKEAALYVATGTMANQISLHVLCRPGRFVACADGAHVATTERTSSATLSGIAFRPIAAADGTFAAPAAAAALAPDPFDVDVVDALAVENTHQMAGGVPWEIERLREVGAAAAAAGVPVYMDGARLFNASVATGVPVREYAAQADALMFCLSKGLGAPIGSVICGTAGMIGEARRAKILFGGAWRQAGIMAAAGLIALRDGPGRLAEDHRRARALAEGLAEATPGAVDPAGVGTNIVFADPSAAGLGDQEMVGRLRDEGVLTNPLGGLVRLVTHLDIDDGDVERAVAAWSRVARRPGRAA